MKSQVNAVWIAGASILAIIGVLSFSLAYQVHSVVRGLHERTIIEAINEMEFVKKASQQSLVYSVYQGTYEVLKFGDYTTEGCDIEKFDNLPYWRTNEKTCAPTSIKTPLRNKVEKIFVEYLTELKETAQKINIKIPEYSVELIINDDYIDAIATTNERLNFKIENLEVSDSGDIAKTVNVAVNRLLEIGKKHFIDKDPVKEQLELSESQLSEIPVIQDLGNGELTGNCKSTSFEICLNPDAEYIYPSKADMLPEACEKRFVKEIVSSINNLNLDSSISLKTKENLIKSSVDTKPFIIGSTNLPTGAAIVVPPEPQTGLEPKCKTSKIANYKDCGCISWACSGEYPVKVGDKSQFKPSGMNTLVTETDPCTRCITTKLEEGAEVCQQYADKVCPTGYGERLVRLSFPTGAAVIIPPGSSVTETKCVKVEKQICPTFCSVSASGNCVICSEFTGECSSCSLVCPKDSVSSPDGTECWGDIKSKECPSGTEEYENTGRCYSKSQVSSVCDLSRSLHTKACSYDYSAEANVLVSIKDGNKYSLYDSVEQKNDMRNIELQFYILSKN